MRETELKILFPTEKLDALRFFMGKKELTVERELEDYLDKTYEKVVPAYVREYVESRLDQESPLEETPGQGAREREPEPQRERQPRQTRRQREQAAAESAASSPQARQPEPLEEPEESQGMSMSM
ncbi:MAG: DUF6103 family protein [Bacillota bacterium]|nr:DUF6103 family protein [Bacillota bacterium]